MKGKPMTRTIHRFRVLIRPRVLSHGLSARFLARKPAALHVSLALALVFPAQLGP